MRLSTIMVVPFTILVCFLCCVNLDQYSRQYRAPGLLSHAAKHYEKVLEIIDKRQKESGDYEVRHVDLNADLY